MFSIHLFPTIFQLLYTFVFHDYVTKHHKLTNFLGQLIVSLFQDSQWQNQSWLLVDLDVTSIFPVILI